MQNLGGQTKTIRAFFKVAYYTEKKKTKTKKQKKQNSNNIKRRVKGHIELKVNTRNTV